MPGHRFIRSLVAAICLILMLSTYLVLTVHADCPGNVAANSGFEEGFSERGAGEITVANGWHPWWQEGPGQEDGYNRRPEYKGEDAARFGRRRVREGNWAQKMFTTFSTHHAGFLQQINVPANSTVTLKAWGQAWSSEKDNPDVSQGGHYEMSVGIDPTGGTDFNSSNIIWSPRSALLDQWVQLSVQAKAKGGTVTLYLRGDAEWRLKHNDVHFDEVCVTYVAPKPKPTAKPRPTDTPGPTDTPIVTPEAIETPPIILTATKRSPTSTPTPARGDIRVLVFEDRNGNGVKEDNEVLLAGARIDLANMQRTPLANYITDGSSEPCTFAGITPGNYMVIETDPPGYESTSPNQWAVVVLGGTQFDLYFADRLQPSPTPTLTPEPGATPLPPTELPPTMTPEPTKPSQSLGQQLYNISGVLLAAVALALPLALRALRSRL